MAKRGNPYRKDVNWDDIKAQFMIGTKSLRTIADEHNINASSLSRRARKEGWKRATGIEQHINDRVAHKKKDIEIQQVESVFPERVKQHVDEIVKDRVEAELMFLGFQSELTKDVLEMWKHDKKSNKPPLGEDYDASMYGKAKIVQDVLTQAKKNVIGDDPIVKEQEADFENDESFAIVVPQGEVERISEVDQEEA